MISILWVVGAAAVLAVLVFWFWSLVCIAALADKAHAEWCAQHWDDERRRS